MAGITVNIDSKPVEILEELKEQQHYKNMWKNKYNELQKELQQSHDTIDQWENDYTDLKQENEKLKKDQTRWSGLMEYTKTLTGTPSNTKDLTYYIKELQELVQDGVVHFMNSGLLTQLKNAKDENEKLKDENEKLKETLELIKTTLTSQTL